MVYTVILLVILSGFLHALWNLFTKKSTNKFAFLWHAQLVAMIVFLPWALMVGTQESYTLVSVSLLLLSMLVHAIYTGLLAYAYTIGDMSQVYPIMRGTSPLLVPVIGVTVLHEQLSLFGWLGVLLIVMGMFLLSDLTYWKRPRLRRQASKAPLVALAVGICITANLVINKITLLYFHPVVLNGATHLGNFIVLSWVLYRLRTPHIKAEFRLHWRTILLGGVIAPGGYLLFLYALSLAPVSQLAPMREIGTVFGTIMGIWILGERQGSKRIISSIWVTSGVLLLGLWGS
ncbi:DMT family transporter [Marinicrinis sediminis]|uniref:DMT family transporter n=1 Tax=Marinicrinis sediminis TaxID=1652465 RepID=A0ABW5R8V3_9BACL